MLNPSFILRAVTLVLCLSALALQGCDSGKKKTNANRKAAEKASKEDQQNTSAESETEKEPERYSGPDISGSWSGVYYINEVPDSSQSVTATVEQDGNALVISTSLSGIGSRFTGRIDNNGDIRVTDSFDGELWTTHDHVASSSFVELEDYRRDISLTALAVIRLTR